MNNILKNTAKFAVGTCFTLGAVAVAASVVAGSNVGKIVTAGFKGAKSAVGKELAAMKAETVFTEEDTMVSNAAEVSPADFEN